VYKNSIIKVNFLYRICVIFLVDFFCPIFSWLVFVTKISILCYRDIVFWVYFAFLMVVVNLRISFVLTFVNLCISFVLTFVNLCISVVLTFTKVQNNT